MLDDLSGFGQHLGWIRDDLIFELLIWTRQQLKDELYLFLIPIKSYQAIEKIINRTLTLLKIPSLSLFNQPLNAHNTKIRLREQEN